MATPEMSIDSVITQNLPHRAQLLKEAAVNIVPYTEGHITGRAAERVEMTDSHAEVGDEGGLRQLHLKEDFLRGVRFVQSLRGHDGVGET